MTLKFVSPAFIAVGVALMLGVTTGFAAGAPTMVKTADELAQAVKSAKPGSVISIADGNYTNFQVSLRGHGLDGEPIQIAAQTPGKVVFTGESSIELDGTWMVLSGVKFTNGNPPTSKSKADQTSSAISVRGSHNRVTETVIEDYSLRYKNSPSLDPSKPDLHRWIGLWGHHNRVDHSHFQGKRGAGVLLTVWRETSEPNYHQIDHNAFIDVAYGHEQNGWETIRIGTSTHSQSNSYTVVEYNYFDHCDGEIEIISNKSGSNTFRFNTFVNSRGTLTMRHGTGSTVENNFFSIDSDSLGGGVRVSDKGHVIRNNYFEGVRGSTLHWAGILLLAHSKDAPINDYWPVEDVVVEDNAIINSLNSLVVGGGRALQSPVSATIRNNLLCNTLANAFESNLYNRVTTKEGRFALEAQGNVICASPNGPARSELGEDSYPVSDMARVGDFLLPKTQRHGFKPFRKTNLSDVGPRTFSPHL